MSVHRVVEVTQALGERPADPGHSEPLNPQQRDKEDRTAPTCSSPVGRGFHLCCATSPLYPSGKEINSVSLVSWICKKKRKWAQNSRGTWTFGVGLGVGEKAGEGAGSHHILRIPSTQCLCILLFAGSQSHTSWALLTLTK